MRCRDFRSQAERRLLEHLDAGPANAFELAGVLYPVDPTGRSKAGVVLTVLRRLARDRFIRVARRSVQEACVRWSVAS